jgi:hypothetical protein
MCIQGLGYIFGHDINGTGRVRHTMLYHSFTRCTEYIGAYFLIPKISDLMGLLNMKQNSECISSEYLHPLLRSALPSHYTYCSIAASVRSAPRRRLDHPTTRRFTRLNNNTWLHNRPAEGLYRIPVDAYRLRADDDVRFEANGAPYDKLHGDVTSVLGGFRRFLLLAASCSGLLPPWWDEPKQRVCETFAMVCHPSHFQNLRRVVGDYGILWHYRDT